ncbi:PadR family transcriptional regulator [Bacillus sp. 1P06AnD]|uniref:PadR family transcriptional regulator n=1 Tax=Bacillus sp. 1P06AnD TaxID=3132208 RepID=UPI0039A1B394
MNQRSLVILGLLMSQSQHGYQINEFIERNLNNITDMKKPTAYATLDKLSRKGYIDEHLEQEGNRPPRKVYTINEKGTAYFYELLLDNLRAPESIHFQGDVGLMFIDHLPIEDTLKALAIRLENSKKLLEQLEKMPDHEEGIGVNLAIKHKWTMLQTEIAFLEETIDQHTS